MKQLNKSRDVGSVGTISSVCLTDDGLFHYTTCGLENIYLKSGFEISNDGSNYSIEGVEALHDCISMELLTSSRELSGAELRFLRKEMSLTQSRVASLIGVNVQTVARWEKGNTDNPLGEKMIKTLYYSMKCEGPASELGEYLNKLSELDIMDHEEWLFEQKNNEHTWHKCAA